MLGKLKLKIESFLWSVYTHLGWDDRLTAKIYQDQITTVIQLLNKQRIRSDERVLDAGCGTGNYSLALAKEGFIVVGIDFAPAMLKNAQQKAKNTQINLVSFHQGDLNKTLPYPDEYFDHVVIMQVLSYVHDPDFTIRELFRVLKRGGSLLAKIMLKQREEGLLNMVKHRICSTPRENISRIRYFLKTAFRVFGLIGAELQGQHRWDPEDFSKYLTSFCSRVEVAGAGKTLFLAIKE